MPPSQEAERPVPLSSVSVAPPAAAFGATGALRYADRPAPAPARPPLVDLADATAALRASETRFRLATEALAGYVYDVDAATGRVERTAGLADLVGWRPQDAEPTTEWWTARIHPDDWDALRPRLLEAHADPACLTHTAEYRVRHRDGHWVWVSDRRRFVRDAVGRVTRVVGGATDVTARRTAEASVAASEERLRLAQAAAKLGTWDLDFATDTVTWSDAYYALHGLDPARHAPSQELWERSLHPDDRARVIGHVATALGAGAGQTEIEYRIVRPDGAIRWILGRGEVVRGADGLPVRMLGANLDVTERKEAEAERERLLAAERAAREEAERLRRAADQASHAKSEFLAVMSHELRTPLNAIGGHVQLLDMELHGPVTAPQRDALARIARAQRHLLGLINDVLNFARLEAGRVEYDLRPLALPELVADVAPMIEPQLAARGLRYAVEVAPDAPCVVADREKLAQVLLNLLSNAVKFTDAGGAVTVGVHPHPDDAGRVCLRVRDTGRGIPPEKQAAVFEPFVQLDASRTRTAEGTGLGLAISRDLARGMGGDLLLASAPGEGATFTIVLRAADRAP